MVDELERWKKAKTVGQQLLAGTITTNTGQFNQ
jgi:hypothetical protein